jgi:hypothetical protein
VAYWASIKLRAEELIPNAVPGLDYAITELVHCKSKSEFGVPEAVDECVSRHFESAMSVAVAPIIVALGAFAWKQFLVAGVEPPKEPIEREIGGRMRTLVFLAHPAAFKGPKTLAGGYAEHLAALRRLTES